MKTTTQESVVDFLMSQLEICETKEDLILAFWLYWCESVTLNDREFQKVIANAGVNKWFLMELKKLESEFKLLIADYPDTNGKDKDWMYVKTVQNLMSKFPQALLEHAKKREQKPQLTKVAGIKIDFLIINQN